jgi:hypothetical protein
MVINNKKVWKELVRQFSLRIFNSVLSGEEIDYDEANIAK